MRTSFLSKKVVQAFKKKEKNIYGSNLQKKILHFKKVTLKTTAALTT